MCCTTNIGGSGGRSAGNTTDNASVPPVDEPIAMMSTFANGFLSAAFVSAIFFAACSAIASAIRAECVLLVMSAMIIAPINSAFKTFFVA